MKVSEAHYQRIISRVYHMDQLQQGWPSVWREVSDFFLPRRYPWTSRNTGATRSRAGVRNAKLLDSTSTRALRTLATGMMNGISSPSRPWFRLSLRRKKYEEIPSSLKSWLETATDIMLDIMKGTNLYNSLGIFYTEWSAMGTASLGIYPHFENVFHCVNFPVGSYYIDQDENGIVNRHARRMEMKLEDIYAKWNGEGLTDVQKLKAQKGTVSERTQELVVVHLIEPNTDDLRYPGVRKSAKYREIYYVEGNSLDICAAKGLDRFRPITARWETYATDRYGTSPCMEAIPDVISLQHLTRRQAQGLDKMVDPPMLAHISLANRPKSFIPGAVTYVNSADLQQGARPTYQIGAFPFQELQFQQQGLQQRIQQTLYNDLFRMIADLQTVRSASEIDARREEKFTLLGPVLERFEFEGLSRVVEEIFWIILEAGLFPPLPEELKNEDIDIQYTSMLSDAQRAVSTIPTERWLQLLAGVAQFYPQALEIPDWDAMLRDYADSIGVKESHRKPKEEVEERQAMSETMQQAEQAAGIGSQLASGAAQLASAEVGGGMNALQAMMGEV